MQNICLIVEYDGSGYCGFQDQARPDRPSVQAALEKAVHQVTGEAQRVHGAGRTDAGVHAYGQVVHFHTHSRIPAERMPYALNRHLPFDIVVKEARRVPDAFHARKSATSKTYEYVWYNRSQPSPFWRPYAHFVPQPLYIPAMQEAAQAFVGRHDFSAFRSAQATVRSSVRTVLLADVTADLPWVRFTVEGDGFLQHMVRIMAGTLLQIGLGKEGPESVAAALRSKLRNDAGPTAPPQGLYLVRVNYEA